MKKLLRFVERERARERELEDCRSKCKELEESKNAEEKCVVVESEIGKRKIEFESLESKFSGMEVIKIWIEEL